jgi:hypothetical protein
MDSLDRANKKMRKINEANKTLAGMFHVGKGERAKGRGFMALPNNADNEDMAVKLVLDAHYAFMVRLWEMAKRMTNVWTNWDSRKGSSCHHMLYNLRDNMPKD